MWLVIAYVTEKERRDVATLARSIRGLKCCQTASSIYFSLLWSWVISYLFLEPGLLLLLFLVLDYPPYIIVHCIVSRLTEMVPALLYACWSVVVRCGASTRQGTTNSCIYGHPHRAWRSFQKNCLFLEKTISIQFDLYSSAVLAGEPIGNEVVNFRAKVEEVGLRWREERETRDKKTRDRQ